MDFKYTIDDRVVNRDEFLRVANYTLCGDMEHDLLQSKSYTDYIEAGLRSGIKLRVTYERHKNSHKNF